MSEEYFDWVTTRSQCFVNVAFERLKRHVKRDIEAWKALPNRDPGQIVPEPQGDDYFTVTKNGRPDAPRVAFTLGHNEVTVESSGRGKQRPFRATLTLNKDRLCRFVVDGQEMEEWQLRQKALDPLFFPQWK